MNLILVGCALQRETRRLDCLRAPRVELLTTGFGQRRTAAGLRRYLDRNRPDLFVFAGTAGQLDPCLQLGTVVCPRSWKLEDGREIPAHAALLERLRSAGWALDEPGLTVRRPVLRPRRRAELWQRHSACVCDMESARALAVAHQFGVPALAVKVVSDTAESSLRDFWRKLDDNLETLAQALQQLLPILAGERPEA